MTRPQDFTDAINAKLADNGTLASVTCDGDTVTFTFANDPNGIQTGTFFTATVSGEFEITD